jgi:RND family efflux transporter MFP subunit
MTKNLTILKVLAVLTIILTSCKTEAVKEESPVFVKTTNVKTPDSTLTKNYPGKIKSASDINLSFRVAGPIEELNIREGDRVEKGEVVARIDSRDYKIQLEATEAKYREVKAEVERITALYKKNKVSENNYDKAVSGLKQIRAKYNAHKNALEDTKLRAPFSGHINKIYFDAGEIVDAGMPVVSLIDAGQYEIVTHLSANDYLKKDNFTSFTCRSANAPGQEWTLELRNIGSQANLNGLYPAYFRFKPGKQEAIFPGMSAEIIIKYSADEKNIFEIPSSAIFNEGDLSKVWIFNHKDSTITAQTVKIVKIHSSGSAIISGELLEQESIISAGVHSLREGQKVKPLPEVSDTNVGKLM